MSPIERLLRKATRHYYASVAAHQGARNWYYNLYQVLEGDGEVPNIPSSGGRFDDEWIEKNFDRQTADEKRHQMLWIELLKRRGIFDPDGVPTWANNVDRLFGSDWFVAPRALTSRQHAHPSEFIAMFAGLHALETLASERFKLMAEELRPIDAEAADVLEAIVRDEKFHVAYTRESALRLGRRYDCLDYAQACIEKAIAAHQKFAISMIPQYVGFVRKMGVRFSPWFLLLNALFKLYRFFAPDLASPPPMPARLSAGLPGAESPLLRSPAA